MHQDALQYAVSGQDSADAGDTGKLTPLSDREKGAARSYLPLWKR